MLELSDIAWPAVSHHGGERIRRHRLHILLHALCGAPYEVVHEQRNVLSTVAQWWNRDHEPAESKVQVLAKGTCGNRSSQVAVGGGDNPCVYLDRPFGANATNLTLLESAQQLRLDCRRDLTHFVQEQRAVRRDFEQAGFVANSPSERATNVPEEF